jgi:hypothetical protein
MWTLEYENKLNFSILFRFVGVESHFRRRNARDGKKLIFLDPTTI